MKTTYKAIFLFTILGLVISPVHGQESLDLDFSLEMPDIDTIEGSISAPANLNLLLQGIIKIFADENGDGNITQAEADSFLDIIPEEERANLSLRLEDLEPIIQAGIGIDYQEPRAVEVLDMEFIGLVGPVNSSQPLGFLISFKADYNIDDSFTHTISIGVNESYTGDVDFEFTIPSGWEVDRVSGLTGKTVEGRTVYGTPIGQVDIRISEEVGTEAIYLCIGIGVVIIIVIIIVIVLLLKRKGKEAPVAPPLAQPYTAPAPPPPMSQPRQPPPRPVTSTSTISGTCNPTATTASCATSCPSTSSCTCPPSTETSCTACTICMPSMQGSHVLYPAVSTLLL